MPASIGLIFDILILAALLVTIRQAWRLSREFAQMQADRKAFENLISSLNIASSRAESAIKGLRDTATETGDALQDRINKGRALADELDIMIQAGDSMANRLGLAAEQKTKPAAKQAPAAAATPAAAGAPLSRAEKELLEALKARQQN